MDRKLDKLKKESNLKSVSSSQSFLSKKIARLIHLASFPERHPNPVIETERRKHVGGLGLGLYIPEVSSMVTEVEFG